MVFLQAFVICTDSAAIHSALSTPKTSVTGANSISRTQQGIKNLTDAEAEAVIGKCRESNQRDLYYSIENGDFPRWTMFVQIMTEEEATQLPYNPFDLTKVWYKEDFPLIEVGVF